MARAPRVRACGEVDAEAISSVLAMRKATTSQTLSTLLEPVKALLTSRKMPPASIMSPYAGFVDMVVKVYPRLKPTYVTVYDGVVLYNNQKPFVGCNVYRDARAFAQGF